MILLLIYIGMYDIKNKKITNKSNVLLFGISLSNYVLRVLLQSNISLLEVFTKVIVKIVIALVMFLILILLRKIFNNNIGGGDIKMYAALMINFSLIEMITIIIISIFLSFIYSMYLLFIKHKNKDYKFSFGEFISFGTILVILIY